MAKKKVPRVLLVMDKMDRTLRDVLEAQEWYLTKPQARQIRDLVQGLGQLGIYHNDSQVLLNIMEKAGRFYMIDFGMSKRCQPSHGQNPNMSILAHIDRHLKTPMFTKTIASFEQRHAETVDVRAAMQRAVKARAKKRAQELLSRH